VKNTVYQVKINNLQQLKPCIRDAVATVTPNMLQATWNGSNIWIFVVPPRELTFKFIEKVMYLEKKLRQFPFVMV
jgi:hypothetical protein